VLRLRKNVNADEQIEYRSKNKNVNAEEQKEYQSKNK